MYCKEIFSTRSRPSPTPPLHAVLKNGWEIYTYYLFVISEFLRLCFENKHWKQYYTFYEIKSMCGFLSRLWNIIDSQILNH